MTSEAPTQSWFKGWRWLLLPLAPILLPIYLLVVLIVLAVAAGFVVFVKPVLDRISAHLLRRAMAAEGRTATWEHVEAELARGPGTLIVEHPAAGWADTNIWWMNRADIGDLAHEAGLIAVRLGEAEPAGAFERRIEAPAFERWCLAKFIDRSTGCARLVQTSRSGRAWKRVQERINDLRAKHRSLDVFLAATWMAHEAAAQEARAGP